jgi:hypothetical protein
VIQDAKTKEAEATKKAEPTTAGDTMQLAQLQKVWGLCLFSYTSLCEGCLHNYREQIS